jgi:hypothetical protein
MPTHDLRAQFAYLHEAIGTALIRQQSYGAAEIILAEALKGNTMTDYDPPPPPDIPDEYPDPTPGGPPPPEW